MMNIIKKTSLNENPGVSGGAIVLRVCVLVALAAGVAYMSGEIERNNTAIEHGTATASVPGPAR